MPDLYHHPFLFTLAGRVMVLGSPHQLDPVVVEQWKLEAIGWQMRWVSNDSAWPVEVRRFKPQLIIIAGKPFGKSAAEVCEEVRNTSDAKILVELEGSATIPDRIAALDAGADDVVDERISLDELLWRMRTLLLRTFPPRPEVLRFEDLELDVEARVLRRAGVPIPVSAKELTLVEFLLRHPSRMSEENRQWLRSLGRWLRPRSLDG